MASTVEQAMEHIITAYNEGRYAGQSEPDGVPKEIPLEFSVSRAPYHSEIPYIPHHDTLFVKTSQGEYLVGHQGSTDADVLRIECLPQDGISVPSFSGSMAPDNHNVTWEIPLQDRKRSASGEFSYTPNGTEEKIIALAERLGFERAPGSEVNAPDVEAHGAVTERSGRE